MISVCSLIVTNFTFNNINLQASAYEDVIYLNGKGPVPLTMRSGNNVITSCSGRYGINNATNSSNINGSVFINNYISRTYTKPYIISTKDRWIFSPVVNNNKRKKSYAQTPVSSYQVVKKY